MSKYNVSKYNPMSKEFQEEAKRLGLTGNELISIYKKEEKIFNDANRTYKKYQYFIEYFDQFVIAINPYIQWLKDEINKSKDKKIRIKIKEITKAMGEPFTSRSDNIIYKGLKFALFIEGIVVNISNSKMLSSNSKILSSEYEDEEVILIMSIGNENDTLPYPFSEHLIHYLQAKNW